MNQKPLLPNLRTVSYADWLTGAASSESKKLCVTTSGYESRSIHWASQTLKALARRDDLKFHTIGFDDFKTALSRPDNDAFYASKSIDIRNCGSSRENVFLDDVESQLKEFIASADEKPIEVHVDYSCMPRRWYCALPSVLRNQLRPIDVAYFWYTPGRYKPTTYPTAGTSDFTVFSGRPTLSCPSRTHLFGLGFDRVRSQAIWSVLDPHTLVCFYANPTVEAAYIKRVEQDNREVLNAAAFTFTVPLGDFVACYSRIVAIVNQFRSQGDVIIVPDGPKPLVLASSLIPLTAENSLGIVCFHVAKRGLDRFTPVDVSAKCDPVGFAIGRQGTSEKTASNGESPAE